MKQTIFHAICLLFLCGAGCVQAQTSTETNAEANATRPGVAVSVAQPKANFEVEQGTLRLFTDNLNRALQTKRASDLARCFVTDSDARWWLTQFDSKNTAISPEQASSRIMQLVAATEQRLQALQNTYAAFTVVTSEAMWADPDHRSKAIMLTGNLVGSNGGNEPIRLILAIIDGHYKIISMK
jgi:hypothetical protein